VVPSSVVVIEKKMDGACKRVLGESYSNVAEEPSGHSTVPATFLDPNVSFTRAKLSSGLSIFQGNAII